MNFDYFKIIEKYLLCFCITLGNSALGAEITKHKEPTTLCEALICNEENYFIIYKLDTGKYKKDAELSIENLCEKNTKFKIYKDNINFRFRPIHLAAIFDNIIIVQKLLSMGVSLNEQSSDATTPADFAAQFGSFKTLDLLLKKKAQAKNPIYYAVLESQNRVLEILLEKGFNPNLPNLKETPLVYAAGTGNIKAINLFFAYGIDLDRDENQFALSKAVNNWQFKAVKLLCELGCNRLDALKNYPEKTNIPNEKKMLEILSDFTPPKLIILCRKTILKNTAKYKKIKHILPPNLQKLCGFREL